MQELEKTQENDTRNFSEKWLNNIYEILMRLEDYERLLKNGCLNLMEFVENPYLNLTIAQHKNYEFFMTEIEIILNDIKFFIPKKDFLSLSLKLLRIKNLEIDCNGFLDLSYNDVSHERWHILKPEFEYVKLLISDLRGCVVRVLFKFIDPKIKKNVEEKL